MRSENISASKKFVKYEYMAVDKRLIISLHEVKNIVNNVFNLVFFHSNSNTECDYEPYNSCRLYICMLNKMRNYQGV